MDKALVDKTGLTTVPLVAEHPDDVMKARLTSFGKQPGTSKEPLAVQRKKLRSTSIFKKTATPNVPGAATFKQAKKKRPAIGNSGLDMTAVRKRAKLMKQAKLGEDVQARLKADLQGPKTTGLVDYGSDSD